MQLVHEPDLVAFGDRPYIGIKFSAPYAAMFSVVDSKFRQLRRFVRNNKLVAEGPYFLRYHVIDMSGTMELEIGLFGTYAIPDDPDIMTGIAPGGTYAVQVYKGLGLAANKHLLQWIQDNKYPIDKESTAKGDVFSCRYEAYLTDPKIEPRKKQWDIELAIKLLDNG